MKTYPGIDYGFRPQSYWDPNDPLQSILQNVKGENRRQMILHYLKKNQLEELHEDFLRVEVDADTREQLGRIDPSFMGGEYLPGYLPGEVEIARICLQSTTSDVISLRARPTASGKIAYRIVDEYDDPFSLPIAESDLPLTFAELVQQFDEGRMEDPGFPDGGLSLGYNNLNAKRSRAFERLRHFTRISSPFYRHLCQHYEQVFDEWVAYNTANRDCGQ
jgi:hypothetical protein